MIKTATLALEDGTILRGESFGADGEACAEVVFNTSLTGYQEIITDPSYAGQMIVFTCTHIGNVGANAQDYESPRAPSAGVAPTPGPHVVVYDFGVKRNILRRLVSRGCRVSVVPAATTAAETLELHPDGVLLSNGPGDPAALGYAVDAVRGLLNSNVP